MAPTRMQRARLAELGITMGDVQAFRAHTEGLRRGKRQTQSRMAPKDDWEAEYKLAAKWKKQMAAKERRKQIEQPKVSSSSKQTVAAGESESSKKQKKGESSKKPRSRQTSKSHDVEDEDDTDIEQREDDKDSDGETQGSAGDAEEGGQDEDDEQDNEDGEEDEGNAEDDTEEEEDEEDKEDEDKMVDDDEENEDEEEKDDGQDDEDEEEKDDENEEEKDDEDDDEETDEGVPEHHDAGAVTTKLGSKRAQLVKKLSFKRPRVAEPQAPHGFNTSPLEDYDSRLVGRRLCKMCRVKIEKLDNEYGFPLSNMLKNFKKFLDLSGPFSESVVKVFYTNLIIDKRSNVHTTVRGQKIVIREKDLLACMGIDLTYVKGPKLSKRDIDTTLLAGTDMPIGGLIRPKQLPDKHRVLHYFYSRNFVNKGRHFTSLNDEDKYVLACIIKGKPFNLAGLIVDNMLAAAHFGKKNKELPYPTLVTLILKMHKVWYLQSGERPLWTEEFDVKALNHMQIRVPGTHRHTIPTSATPQSKGKGIHYEMGSSSGPPPTSDSPSLQQMCDAFARIVDDKMNQVTAHVQGCVAKVATQIESLGTEVHCIRQFMDKYESDLKAREEELAAHSSGKAQQEDLGGPSTAHDSPIDAHDPGNDAGQGKEKEAEVQPTNSPADSRASPPHVEALHVTPLSIIPHSGVRDPPHH